MARENPRVFRLHQRYPDGSPIRRPLVVRAMCRLGPPRSGLAGMGNNTQSSSESIACKPAASGRKRISVLLSHRHGMTCAVAGGLRAPISTWTEALFRDVVELSSRPRLEAHACGEICGGHSVSPSASAVRHLLSTAEKKERSSSTCESTEEPCHNWENWVQLGSA